LDFFEKETPVKRSVIRFQAKFVRIKEKPQPSNFYFKAALIAYSGVCQSPSVVDTEEEMLHMPIPLNPYFQTRDQKDIQYRGVKATFKDCYHFVNGSVTTQRFLGGVFSQGQKLQIRESIQRFIQKYKVRFQNRSEIKANLPITTDAVDYNSLRSVQGMYRHIMDHRSTHRYYQAGKFWGLDQVKKKNIYRHLYSMPFTRLARTYIFKVIHYSLPTKLSHRIPEAQNLDCIWCQEDGEIETTVHLHTDCRIHREVMDLFKDMFGFRMSTEQILLTQKKYSAMEVNFLTLYWAVMQTVWTRRNISLIKDSEKMSEFQLYSLVESQYQVFVSSKVHLDNFARDGYLQRIADQRAIFLPRFKMLYMRLMTSLVHDLDWLASFPLLPLFCCVY